MSNKNCKFVTTAGAYWRSYKANVLHVPKPNRQSQAALIALQRHYINEMNQQYRRARERFIHDTPKVCKLCGRRLRRSQITLDHIVPVAAGGSVLNPCNFQILCRKCHNKKDARYATPTPA